jgi:hypothetical protein
MEGEGEGEIQSKVFTVMNDAKKERCYVCKGGEKDSR